MKKFVFDDTKYGFELLMDVIPLDHQSKDYFVSKPHSIDFFEIFLLETAKGQFQFESSPIKIQDFHCFFISPGQTKCCRVTSSKLKGYHLIFKNGFLDEFFLDQLFVYKLPYFFNQNNQNHLVLNSDQYYFLKLTLQEINVEIHNYQENSAHIIRSLLYFLLIKLKQHYTDFYSLPNLNKTDNLAYRFKLMLANQFQTKFQVNDYATALQVSRQQLNRVLHKTFQTSAKTLIDQRRVQEIKNLLLYSSLNINEIADQLHFSEGNNLIRFFKNQTNMSPYKYKKMFQNDSFEHK